MSSGKTTKSGGEGAPETLPDVRAILVSDLHLQAKPPVARSTEPDWFAAMARPLNEIANLAEEHGCPVLYAGDIFDRWNAGPEVINFALRHLPHGYAIPGQHDLPNHNYDDIKRTAYWTLVEAEHIVDLTQGQVTLVGHDLFLYGFPWGFDPQPITPSEDGELNVALVHKFIWTDNTGYTGASMVENLVAYKGNLTGYDVVAFGDNHKGFIRHTKGGPTICNCGGMMRRKTDERDYRPGCGLLRADGTVGRHYFDTTQDHFIELTAEAETVDRLLDMTEFVTGLQALGANDALDFDAAVKRFLTNNDIPPRVREVILSACVANK